MSEKRRFFLNFEQAPVHDGDQWVGIAIGLDELKAKYKQTLEKLRNADEYDYTSYYGLREDQLMVYEYTEEDGFSRYPTQNLEE
ncbi:MAG: hypothetical protein GX962_14210 [Epulopiscium sp.]|jgi:hypothetical protein|nr:hypothetical protein [Candidatus Epulonipiscium sp.]